MNEYKRIRYNNNSHPDEGRENVLVPQKERVASLLAQRAREAHARVVLVPPVLHILRINPVGKGDMSMYMYVCRFVCVYLCMYLHIFTYT